jgi:putative PIN family toxin of toxin-antitoxin system
MNFQNDPLKVAVDTNVLVSAFWSEHNRLTQILTLILNDFLIPCYSAEIMKEYLGVLHRPNLSFHFKEAKVEEIIEKIKADGLSVAVRPSLSSFIDESDRIFYDVAKSCDAYLITQNGKHFPNEPFILTPTQFLALPNFVN